MIPPGALQELSIYSLADLGAVLGDRGYRAAQLEGGIRGGLMYLTAYALRFGATGLTFLDDEVTLDTDGRLCAIGKKLPVHTVDGESIGMLMFRGAGVKAWRDALDRAIRLPEALRSWYLSVVNEMAQKMTVETVSIEGCWWAEIDCHADLDGVRGHYLQD